MKSRGSMVSKVVVVALIFFFLNFEAQAFQSQFEVGGSVRLRSESKANFNFDDSNQNYVLSQFRLNANWYATKSLKIYVELQDARILTQGSSVVAELNDEARPNIFQDQLDVHQLFADANFNLNKTPVHLRIGRQKLNVGALRLLSSLEWVNTARVNDGMRVTIGNTSKLWVDFFTTRVVPVTPGAFNDYDQTGSRYFNSTLSGFYLHNKSLFDQSLSEFYVLHRNSPDNNDAVTTAGARLDTKREQLHFNAEVAGQFGEFNGLDHLAYMLHVEVGYRLEGAWSTPRISTAYNFGSGDGDPNDNKHNTFDNLYGLNHAYYGYMDIFGLQNLHNWELVTAGKFNSKLSYRVGFQTFFLAQENTDAWYNAGLGVVRRAESNVESAHVGNEIDLTFNYTIQPKWTAVLGASVFMRGQYVDETGNSNVNPSFLFLMTKFSF